LLGLARTSGGWRFRVARGEARPSDERWLPAGLRGRGTLTLRGGGPLRADVTLETSAGTELALALELADGRLDGTSLTGRLALADAARSGFLGSAVEASGLAAVDATVARTTPSGSVVLAAIRSDEVALVWSGSRFLLEAATALVRADASGVMWN